MSLFADWSTVQLLLLFVAAAAAIAVLGTRLTLAATRLAEVTGLGQAITGAVFLGGSTSLPGIATSVTAAAAGHAELAIGNAVGGIAAQTVFLAIADMAHRKINLEHAAASVANLMHGTLLIALLSLPLLAAASPHLAIGHVHPGSLLLLLAYVGGLRIIASAQQQPMWRPHVTRETRLEPPVERSSKTGRWVWFWLHFVLLAGVVSLAGFAIAHTGVAISSRLGVSQTVVGALFTAIATSLPELVTAIAAVRQGALTLAVANIIGGNCFDVLFIAFADFAYDEGSIYVALSAQQLFVIALTLLLTAVLLLGLLRREKHGIGNIGFESFLILLLYLFGFLFLFVYTPV